MKSLAGVLALLSIGCLIGGGQAFYVWLGNSEVTEISCEEYAGERPPAKWLRLSDCRAAALEDIVYEEMLGGSVTELFIPLRAPGAGGDARAAIVLATKERDLLRYVEESLKGADKIDAFAGRLDALLDDDVEGLVRFGVDLKDEERDQIAALAGQLDDDFVLLAHGVSPLEAHVFASMLGAGLLMGPLAVLLFLRSRRR